MKPPRHGVFVLWSFALFGLNCADPAEIFRPSTDTEMVRKLITNSTATWADTPNETSYGYNTKFEVLQPTVLLDVPAEPYTLEIIPKVSEASNNSKVDLSTSYQTYTTSTSTSIPSSATENYYGSSLQNNPGVPTPNENLTTSSQVTMTGSGTLNHSQTGAIAVEISTSIPKISTAKPGINSGTNFSGSADAQPPTMVTLTSDTSKLTSVASSTPELTSPKPTISETNSTIINSQNQTSSQPSSTNKHQPSLLMLCFLSAVIVLSKGRKE